MQEFGVYITLKIHVYIAAIIDQLGYFMNWLFNIMNTLKSIALSHLWSPHYTASAVQLYSNILIGHYITYVIM